MNPGAAAEKDRTPVLSLILITPDSFETVRRTCGHLAAQTIAGQLELVLCVPREEELRADAELLSRFARVSIVETGDCRVVAKVKAMAVRRAGAPYVAFIEEHAFPHRQYAQLLLEGLEGGCAAVGPRMVNANPKLPASWANFVIEYGPWAGWSEPRSSAHLPGNNGSYHREALLSFGPELEAMLDAESLLHWELGRRGEGLLQETRAKVFHVNITAFAPFWRVHFYYSRMFGAARAAAWPVWKRLLYAGGGPLIPLIRLKRHLPDVWRVTPGECRTASFWALLTLGLLSAAAGEVAGYLSGAGSSRERIYWLEFHRPRYLAKNDAMPDSLPGDA
ncbi:MAG: hypothetical protein U5J83_15520 [Bryobacterales bacterium]|nr:hypothetical protein [Bryobacterales bacterium]